MGRGAPGHMPGTPNYHWSSDVFGVSTAGFGVNIAGFGVSIVGFGVSTAGFGISIAGFGVSIAGFKQAEEFIGKLREIWASALKNVLQRSSEPKQYKHNRHAGGTTSVDLPGRQMNGPPGADTRLQLGRQRLKCLLGSDENRYRGSVPATDRADVSWKSDRVRFVRYCEHTRHMAGTCYSVV
jgi:hypothetical protein